ncbi:hypothetical protein JKP88DRAFT_265120 [Tribonema minus]|uniref:RING-type domain-containing protein n=1 Tax=Tribonema minus TaxID=303371 RepID=A0A836C9U0_9STRA|nr:hypothetical protein JKP88DRAFT_265120 [Tribonema minus]
MQEHMGPPPPASKKALRQIPEVLVTLDDLVEEANRCCSICLDDHMLAEVVCRLPCAHIFHKECVLDWLLRNCTCPACRYELETENAAFEAGRRQRMQGRTLRFRRRELELSSVARLRSIAGDLGVNTDGCLEKSDLIACIARSPRAEVFEAALPEYTHAQLMALTVRQLKDIMAGVGVLLATGVLEKADLIAQLANSGRIAVVDVGAAAAAGSHCPSSPSSHESSGPSSFQQQNGAQPQQPDVPPQPPQPAATRTSTEGGENDAAVRMENELRHQPVTALKAIMRAESISLAGCLEKNDMVQRIVEARAAR